MDRIQAYRILGLEQPADLKTIKKKYRSLLQLVHPDTQAYHDLDYAYEIYEINAAYEFLLRLFSENNASASDENQKGSARQDQNPAAYMEREIFQYMEDSEGNICGRYCIGKGKYFWTPEEDFELFLLSIYNCSKELLEGKPQETIQKYQGQLAYLLAQQFICQEKILEKLTVRTEGAVKEKCTEKTEKTAKSEGAAKAEKIYYIASMLEGEDLSLPEGTVLYPAGVQNHRLYLMDRNRKKLGYVSFHDDRLYYVLVPMFEQQRVKVKIRLGGYTQGNHQQRCVPVRNLDLWILLEETDEKQIMVNISDQIKKLLRDVE